MNSFIAAHAVHYLSVTYLAAAAVEHHLHHLTARSVTVVAGGVGLLALLLITNGRTSRPARALSAIAVYWAFAIFVGGALLNGLGLRGPAHWPALIVLPALLLALAYHLHLSRRQPKAIAAGTAG